MTVWLGPLVSLVLTTLGLLQIRRWYVNIKRTEAERAAMYEAQNYLIGPTRTVQELNDDWEEERRAMNAARMLGHTLVADQYLRREINTSGRWYSELAKREHAEQLKGQGASALKGRQ